jgi:hypothetical protein
VDEAQRSEQVDIALIAFVVHVLLPAAPSDVIQAELLNIVDGGAAALQRMPTVSLSDSPVSFRFHLAEQSLNFLFSLIVEPGKNGSVHDMSSSWISLARMAAPVLVRRCWSILESYVRDEVEAASCPLPRARTDQAVATARRLELLELDPVISQHLFSLFTASTSAIKSFNTHDSVDSTRLGRSGQRAHLILLYGPLCRCICASNPALRESVRASLEMVGWELCIGQSDWSTCTGRAGSAPMGSRKLGS